MNSNIIPEEFLTYFEKSGGLDSPDYDESINYFKNLEKYSKVVKVKIIGYTEQQRPLYCVVVAGRREFTPREARKSGKAVVWIQNGIHPGEIEGKDATMLLLREILITGEKRHLLDNLILLVIPVINADGHERKSPFNRPNQNGPVSMGWRVNAHNLNLNRDYLKADSSEMKAVLRCFSNWLPDFMIDNHTTNGADYQYHITYGIETRQIIDAKLAGFAKETLIPRFCADLDAAGFLTAPYLELKGAKPEEGFVEMINLPRYSTGYGAVQNRICLLVETHSLKPYENRVYSTKCINQSVLELLHNEYKTIKQLNKAADQNAITKYAVRKNGFPVQFGHTEDAELLQFKGYVSEEYVSPVTGSNVVKYTTKPIDITVPFYRTCTVLHKTKLPFAYIIPPEFTNLVRILRLHGVKVYELANDIELSVNQYSFDNIRFASRPYEGRFRVTTGVNDLETTKSFPKGFYVVPTKQRTIRIIAHLLEPMADDSFVSWGFFNAFFERKEYAEAYVFEPIAQKMLSENTDLQTAFSELLLQDKSFRDSPEARLDYLYQRSGYFDEREKKYPVYRCFVAFRYA